MKFGPCPVRDLESWAEGMQEPEPWFEVKVASEKLWETGCSGEGHHGFLDTVDLG